MQLELRIIKTLGAVRPNFVNSTPLTSRGKVLVERDAKRVWLKW
jgi:hypothetical protein